MEQINIGQLKHEVTLAKLSEWMPCEIVCDGEVVAILDYPHDVSLAKEPKAKKSKAKHDVSLAGLPLNERFSKSAQASGRMRS